MRSNQKKSAPRHSAKREPAVTVNYRLPESALRALDELAARHHITRNSAINIAVSRLLENGI